MQQRLAIFSDNTVLLEAWSSALIKDFSITTLTSLDDLPEVALIIIDSAKVDHEPSITALFAHSHLRFLIIGNEWPEEKQINALVQGAAGYCGDIKPQKLLLQAINSILKGDIWIQRHLVPRVIGTLVKLRPPLPSNKNSDSTNSLSKLSLREHDVASMVKAGENNKAIASTLNISERTVKAHLTSIFKKTNLPDRLQLALYMKEFS